MIYEFTCPNCGWSGTRNCKWDDRSKQTCSKMLPLKATEDGDLDISSVLQMCATALIPAEISLTARLSEQWKRGTR